MSSLNNEIPESTVSDKSKDVQMMTKNEKITLVLSTLALLMTLFQLVFSIPYVTNLFYSPEIIGKRIDDKFSNGIWTSSFVIQNNGNKKAQNVSINMTIPTSSKFTIIPPTLYDVEIRKNGDPLRDLIIKSSEFLPLEQILVIVETDSIDFYKIKTKNDSLTFPLIGIIKHQDGFGKTEKQ